MSFLGPNIIKLNGGLGQTAPSDRNVGALLFGRGYEVGTFTFTTTPAEVFVLNSLDDAEALGLSAATDANVNAANTSACWYHISEFFRLNPDGKLYVFNGDDAAGDLFVTDGGADLVMAAAANKIRYMGVVFGHDPDTVFTTVGGFADFVGTTRQAAQDWVTARAAEFVYVDCVVVEGVGMITAGDQTLLECPQVHITTACDFGYFAAYPAGFKKTAAVGTAIASIGVRMLSESIGSVVVQKLPSEARGRANYSLVDTRKNRWTIVGLSDGFMFNDKTQAERNALRAKAVGYAGSYEGYAGVYFDHDSTCTTVVDDYNTIHINRIWNEAARAVRRALIPRMNSRVQIEPSNGRIKASTIADWDAAVQRELQTLLAEDEIAAFRFVMDPNQDVIAQGKVLVKLSITPQGIAKVIEAEIGFNNPAQA